MKTITEMQSEVTEWAKDKGWYDQPVSFDEAMALLHSEVSEAVEAWRKSGLNDMTHNVGWFDEEKGVPSSISKPGGVGSEFADTLIRWLDYNDRFNLGGARDKNTLVAFFDSFVANMNTLHTIISQVCMVSEDVPTDKAKLAEAYGFIIDFLYLYAHTCKIDLDSEYERKMAYNRTRPYRHGYKKA